MRASLVVFAAGRFGNATGQRNANCTGEGLACFFCPLASTNAAANPCGDVSVYCPPGSGAPRQASKGHFTIGGASDGGNRVSQSLCPAGSSCLRGERTLCFAGSFANVTGL